MKRNYISKRIIAICTLILSVSCGFVNAQDYEKINLAGMWQFNFPVDNKYADTGSGWGVNLEGTYDLTPQIEAGLFLSWHTNNTYVSRRTYTEGTTSITSDQYRSLFQLPFGLMLNYKLTQGKFEPYVGLKAGANYAKYQVYRNTFVNKKDNWGVFVSPEIGATYYPFVERNVGFKVAGYYGFASNKYKTFDMDNINNLGFRLGVVFNL